MKVLIAPSTHNLTNRTYGKTYNIVQNMDAEDIDLELVVSEIDDEISGENIRITALNSGSRPRYYFDAFKYARSRLQQGNFDIYHHMNLSYRWFNPLLLGERTGTQSTLIGPAQASHSIPDEEFRMKLDWLTGETLPTSAIEGIYRAAKAMLPVMNAPRTALFARTLKAADRIVVVNEETKDIYSSFVPEGKIEVIPIGVDLERFNYSMEREPNKLVTVGRLTKRKGFSNLLSAMVEIRKQYPDIELHILGEGPLRDRLVSKAEALDVADAVEFHGRVSQSQVKEHLQSAQAFVHPSLSESFSPVRLEAMATGCPIVATNIVGAQEMIRDGVEGFVVPTDSANALADAIKRILSDDHLAEKMSRSARARTEEKYGWEKIGKSYLETYRSLL